MREPDIICFVCVVKGRLWPKVWFSKSWSVIIRRGVLLSVTMRMAIFAFSIIFAASWKLRLASAVRTTLVMVLHTVTSSLCLFYELNYNRKIYNLH